MNLNNNKCFTVQYLGVICLKYKLEFKFSF